MVNQDPVSMAVSGVVVVLLVDFLRAHQGWGWMRLVQGAAAFKDTPGLLFTKVMGSGHEGGFVLRPRGRNGEGRGLGRSDIRPCRSDRR